MTFDFEGRPHVEVPVILSLDEARAIARRWLDIGPLEVRRVASDEPEAEALYEAICNFGAACSATLDKMGKNNA